MFAPHRGSWDAPLLYYHSGLVSNCTLPGDLKRTEYVPVLVQVLITAGPQGLSIADIIQRANEMGLTEVPWETSNSKRSSMSSVSPLPSASCLCHGIPSWSHPPTLMTGCAVSTACMHVQVLNGEPQHFAHVGKSRYAHVGHKGVVHQPHKRAKPALKEPSGSAIGAALQQPESSQPATTAAQLPTAAHAATTAAPAIAPEPAVPTSHHSLPAQPQPAPQQSLQVPGAQQLVPAETAAMLAAMMQQAAAGSIPAGLVASLPQRMDPAVMAALSQPLPALSQPAAAAAGANGPAAGTVPGAATGNRSVPGIPSAGAAPSASQQGPAHSAPSREAAERLQAGPAPIATRQKSVSAPSTTPPARGPVDNIEEW